MKSLVILLLAGCAVQTSEAPVGCGDADIPAATEPLAGIFVSVLAYQGELGNCGAVAVDEGHAYTAAHCLSDGATVSVGGSTHRVVASAPVLGRDLALLTVEPALTHWLPLASRPARAGDLLELWGYGCGEDHTGAQGPTVRAAVATSDHTAAADTCHGDSGGAVVGSDGLVGILYYHDGESAVFESLIP